VPVGSFMAVSLLSARGAVVTLWRLARDWRSLLDDVWTQGDRELAQLVGVLLLAPPAVWLHEWGHALAFRAFGAVDPQIYFFLYWGYVTARLPLTPDQELVVALAGPLVTYLLGWALLAVALLVPLRPAFALALATCAVVQLSLVLILYPAMSLVGGWGDFAMIYSPETPLASLLVGVVHALSAAAFVWLMSRVWMRGFLVVPLARPWRAQWVVSNEQP
jgi:hypothetical protein